MTSKIISIVQSSVVPGKMQELQALLEKLIDFCRETEPGLLAYDWFINEAGDTCTVIEQYQDSDALLFHVQNYQGFAAALAECRTVKSLVINGDASEALSQAAGPLGAEFNAHFAGL